MNYTADNPKTTESNKRMLAIPTLISDLLERD